MRARFVWIIVPSLLFIFGCSRHEHSEQPAATQQPRPAHPDTFTLRDVDGRQTVLNLQEGRISLRRVRQPVIILYLFSTKAEICRAMLPDLNHLQHRYADKLFLLGIPVPESLEEAALRRYMRRNRIDFFISLASDNRKFASVLTDMLQLGENYPLPVTLIFSEGKLVADYEGVVPIEMIRGDLSDLKFLKKKRKP